VSIPQRRDDLVDLVGYHSAQVAAEVRLNTNESPFVPPPSFTADLEAAIERLALNRYPDRSAAELRDALGDLEGVDASRIFCANGSNEVLQSLLLAYGGPGRRVLVFEPSYALHAHIALVTGTQVVTRQRSEDFRISTEQIEAAVAETSPVITFLCSPNNPTGLSEPMANVRAALRAGGGLVVVDEAYGQFAPTSAASLLDEEDADRLIIVRTFSKTWALAGARLGYCVAAPEVVEACFSVCLPYHLSSLTQQAGLAALRYGDEMRRHVEQIIDERDRVLGALGDLDLELWPSEANFVLLRPRAVDAKAVWQGLLDRSVLVRDCSTWRSLEGCLRVTIGTPEENNRFLEALKEIA
jgi:histidinol-phosphate aminotransferase